MGQYSLLVDSFTIGHFKCINSEYIWVVKIRNTSEAVLRPQYTPWPSYLVSMIISDMGFPFEKLRGFPISPCAT